MYCLIKADGVCIEHGRLCRPAMVARPLVFADHAIEREVNDNVRSLRSAMHAGATLDTARVRMLAILARVYGGTEAYVSHRWKLDVAHAYLADPGHVWPTPFAHTR